MITNPVLERKEAVASSSCASAGEPTLSDLLADPLTEALMRADRIDPAAAKRMFHSVAAVLSTGRADRKKFDVAKAWRRTVDLKAEGTDWALVGAVRANKPPRREFSCGIPCSW